MNQVSLRKINEVTGNCVGEIGPVVMTVMVMVSVALNLWNSHKVHGHTNVSLKL